MAEPNFFTVLSTTRRIIKSNSRHFMYLSLLFVFPLSFSLFISPALSLVTNPLPIYLLTIILSLLATGTLTYSTSEAFLGREVSLSGSIKCLSHSFFSLLATVLATQLIIALILAAFALVVMIVMFAFEGTNYAGFVYTWGGFVFFALGISVLIYLQVSWSLAFVVVVVESKWGFEPLRRSKYLVKEMRLTALALLLLFGVLSVFNKWIFSQPIFFSFGDISRSLGFAAGILGGSFCGTIYICYNLASITVLYMYCKAKHGELPLEIAEEFCGEYVSVSIDDVKVPRVVYMA